MATACLRSALRLNKGIYIKDSVLRVSLYQPATCNPVSAVGQIIVLRHGSFFNKKNADAMWDSATGVSNAGRKRGRASRGKLLRRVNLNFGQRMGLGKTGLVFPGLSSRITGDEKATDLGVRKTEVTDEGTAEEGSKIQKKKVTQKIDILDKGFSGNKMPGKKISPPEPIDGYDFSDFDTYVLETKTVSTVTASQGNIRSASVLVAIGNRKGLFGISLGRGSHLGAAINSAKNKATQKLVYIDIYDGHTPMHNFAEKFHATSVIVYQAPKGHGLRCHHVLKILCQLIGIKDIYIKSEGNVRNYLNLSRAFMTGLLRTRNHQDIADELGHHIVEYRAEKDNYPFIVASPSENAKTTEFQKEDGFEFENYCFNNRLPLSKPSKKPFYWKSAAFKKKLAKDYTRRNQPKAMINRMVLGLQPEFKRLK
ncbi:28S ribosomal protein S5, mitochondrial-like [Mercenaria mercenaria]|uniref:28S ribosomal protein S5, mitochondrial-like n=1 Tax=Mercenaria mercenaria TaxID=6596 RepID=UPI00234E9CEF|nr:28S ribosomal protein S5, mitochondrial-like [Mercenaria mercenaria]